MSSVGKGCYIMEQNPRCSRCSVVESRMKGVLYMIHRDTASRGAEVPLVHVYFVRSLYTLCDKLCDIDSLFQS